MKQNKDKLGFSFRYGLKDEATFNKIIEILTKNQIEHSGNISIRKVTRKYIIVINNIDENLFDPILISSINKKLNLDLEDFDFFISFTTWEQIGGFSIPLKISDFIRIIGGEIQVSIVTFSD
jgi:hypothetical protein